MALDGTKRVENTIVFAQDTGVFHAGSGGEKNQDWGGWRGLHVMRSGVPSPRGQLRPSVVEPKGIPNNPWLSECICFINCD